MAELMGNGVKIEWSNERRVHVVLHWGAEVGAEFRLPAARAIADKARGVQPPLVFEPWER